MGKALVLRASAVAGALAVSSAMLTGCGLSGAGSGTGDGSLLPQVRSQGIVMGGQQPVSGASIQLYTVGITGAGSVSTALITPGSVTTASNGMFTITGDYSCGSATQVYIVASGGNAGSGSNSAISLMAALGPCSSLTPSTFININELTTIAADYALAGFMTDYAHVGATGSNPTALVNAFNTANLLVSVSTGAIPTPPTGMTLPVKQLNTLADILAACVNSAGSASTGCSTLFSATGAAETIGAGLVIAKNPGSSSYTALYSLPSASAPFEPTLSTQPNDFTLAVNYTGAELLSPYGIAIDASGNAWVTNEAGQSVVKLPSLSADFATASYSNGGLLAPRGISIDLSGNIWVANTGGNDVVKLNSLGVAQSGSGYTGGSISSPVAIANDGAGNAWIVNFSGNSITELSSTGTASGASPITGSGVLSAPTSLAIDSAGRVAVSNSATGQLCLFSSAAVLQSCVSDLTLLGATAVAVSGTSVSMAGSTSGVSVAGAFTVATSTGTVNTVSPVSGAGLTLPMAVAYDGTGTAWFANTTSISEFAGSTAISPNTGIGSFNSPSGIAVDASGNIWTANSGDNSVSIFVGMGSPVTTPIAANVGQ